jgi:hypothetical protein
MNTFVFNADEESETSDEIKTGCYKVIFPELIL